MPSRWPLTPTDRFAFWALVAWLAWSLVTTWHHGGPILELWPYWLAPLSAAAGIATSRWLIRRIPLDKVAVAVLVGCTYVFLTMGWRGGAGGGPLRYSNANAALALQLTAFAALVMISQLGHQRRRGGQGPEPMAQSAALSPRGIRTVLDLCMALSVICVLGSLSRAGIGLLVPLLFACVLAMARQIRHRWWSVGIGMAAVAGMAMAVIRLSTWEIWASVFDSAFDPTRRLLWNQAFSLWYSSPIIGSGAGSYREVNILGDDLDTIRAHSSVLQVAAELGFVGMALFAVLILVGFWMLSRGSGSATLTASAAFAVLLIQSFIDHVLEYLPVMFVAGLVIGWASTTRQGSERPLEHEAP